MKIFVKLLKLARCAVLSYLGYLATKFLIHLISALRSGEPPKGCSWLSVFFEKLTGMPCMEFENLVYQSRWIYIFICSILIIAIAILVAKCFWKTLTGKPNKKDDDDEKLVSITVTNGATQRNVNGNKNWIAVRSETEEILITAKTDPNNMEAWSKIRWTGGEAVSGEPNKRKVSASECKNIMVDAELGGVRDVANVWILWATIEILGSGTRPINAAPFDPGMRDNTDNLGAVEYESITSTQVNNGFVTNIGASAKIAAVATLKPAGIGQIIESGLSIKREVWSKNWGDGVLQSSSNSTWSPDHSSARYVVDTPDMDDKIYDTDAPEIRWGQRTYETYNNFRQWVEWNEQKCSDFAPWCWFARWKLNTDTTKQITLNNLKVSQNSPLPQQPFY